MQKSEHQYRRLSVEEQNTLRHMAKLLSECHGTDGSQGQQTEGYERCVHQGSADRDLYDSGTAFAYLSLPVPDVGR